MSGWKTMALGGVLALSLLGNALAVGAGLRIYKLRQEMLGDGAGVTLPRAERRALVAALAAHKDQLHQALAAVQDARQAAVVALMARPYDPARAGLALDALRQAVDALMQQGQAVVLKAASDAAG